MTEPQQGRSKAVGLFCIYHIRLAPAIREGRGADRKVCTRPKIQPRSDRRPRGGARLVDVRGQPVRARQRLAARGEPPGRRSAQPPRPSSLPSPRPQSARRAGATDRARSRLRLHGGRFRSERELKSCQSSPRREPIRGSGEAPYPRRQPVMAIGRVHRRLTAKGPRYITQPTPCSPGPQARPTSKPTSRA